MLDSPFKCQFVRDFSWLIDTYKVLPSSRINMFCLPLDLGIVGLSQL